MILLLWKLNSEQNYTGANHPNKNTKSRQVNTGKTETGREGRRKENGEDRKHPLNISMVWLTSHFCSPIPPIFPLPMLLLAKHLFYPVWAANNLDPPTRLKLNSLHQKGKITYERPWRQSNPLQIACFPSCLAPQGRKSRLPSRQWWHTGLSSMLGQRFRPTSSP